MTISPVSFSGITTIKPAMKKALPAASGSNVAFTGINYGSFVKKANFPLVFKEIKALFGKFINMLKGMQPHVQKADAALGRQMSKIWQTVKPI